MSNIGLTTIFSILVVKTILISPGIKNIWTGDVKFTKKINEEWWHTFFIAIVDAELIRRNHCKKNYNLQKLRTSS